MGISDGDTHLESMKRYSHFDKFHSSLLKTPMATHLKGVHSLMIENGVFTCTYDCVYTACNDFHYAYRIV